MTAGTDERNGVDWQTVLGWAVPERLPDPAECTVRPLLERWASKTPEKLFALFEDGASWSYATLHDEVRRTATLIEDFLR